MDEVWVIDMAVPPRGLKRAGVFVVLTRFKDVEHIRLLRPLWPDRDGYKRAGIIRSFIKTARLDPDLKAELQLLQRNSEATKRDRAQQWQRAVQMVAKRNAAMAEGRMQERAAAG